MWLFRFFITLILYGVFVANVHAGMAEGAQGRGLYGAVWQPDPMHEYWHPGAFHEPV